MVASTLQQPRRGWFDILDDWIKRDRFVFVGWSGLLLFPTAYLAIGGRTLALPLLRHGTPTGWRLPTLKVLIFSQQAVSTPADAMGHSLLLLWGPEAREISSAGANLESLVLCCSPRCICPYRFHASPV